MCKSKANDILVRTELEFRALHFPGLYMGTSERLESRTSGESHEVPVV